LDIATSPTLILASASPRRAELLRAAGYDFLVRIADIDESLRDGESPRDYVLRVAHEKAIAVEPRPDEFVLAADTTVVVDESILAKPVDAADATAMLRRLSGREHDVLTGVCLVRGDHVDARVAATRVAFATMSEAEIAAYVASGEPMDKAGAYGIQGRASRFVTDVHGSYSNVVGLPVALVYAMLNRAGWPSR
jgi:septum formation protein